MKQTLQNWLKNNVDFALFLAVLTETPRWAVAFMAVHEPLYVGIPLGVLLAFATSHAWRAYFNTRNSKLFALNVTSIVIAVAVIAPVMFAMTSHQADQVNINAVLSPSYVWIWATLLALTTFLPLIQLAAVHGIVQPAAQPEPVQPTAQQATRTRTQRTVQVNEQSEQYTIVEPHSAQLPGAQLPVITVQPEPHAVQAESEQLDFSTFSTAQKKAHVLRLLDSKETINQSQLSAQLDVRRQTISAWVKAHSEQEANALRSHE